MTWCGPACLCVNNHSQQPRSSEFAEQTIVDSRDWLSVFFYGCVQFDHLEYQGGVGHISATRKGRFLTLPLRVSFSWLERWNPVREGNHLPPHPPISDENAMAPEVAIQRWWGHRWMYPQEEGRGECAPWPEAKRNSCWSASLCAQKTPYWSKAL